MKRPLQLLILFSFDSALAGGLPANTELTPENSESFSVKLTALDSGDSATSMYRLSFSPRIEECGIGRVQTALFDGEKQVSGSSMDYDVGSLQPSVLFHMPSKGYDMAIALQYCCSTESFRACEKSLSIRSVRAFMARAK